ncbi:MAG: hypothetical protein ABSG46_08245 [Candidatus Binataceae bacterium]|jgi:hypothetical protein
MRLITRSIQLFLVAAIWLTLAAATVYAHGGIAGPDELGPPVITSTLLGIACYWIVMLWPSRRRRNLPKIGTNGRRQ